MESLIFLEKPPLTERQTHRARATRAYELALIKRGLFLPDNVDPEFEQIGLIHGGAENRAAADEFYHLQNQMKDRQHSAKEFMKTGAATAPPRRAPGGRFFEDYEEHSLEDDDDRDEL